MVHFALADRWNTSPVEVLNWPEDIIEDAIEVMQAEARQRKRSKATK